MRSLHIGTLVYTQWDVFIEDASTKATCILNLAVAPVLLQELIENMRARPISISIEGSNDAGLEK